MNNLAFSQISLKAIIKNEEKQVLMLKSDPEGAFKGHYDLPGGRINDSEFETQSFQEVLLREIKEECGPNFEVQILSDKPVAISKWKMHRKNGEIMYVLYIFFEAKYLSGEVKMSDEHQAVSWEKITKENASTYFYGSILDGIDMYMTTQ